VAQAEDGCPVAFKAGLPARRLKAPTTAEAAHWAGAITACQFASECHLGHKDGLMASYDEVPYPSYAYAYTHPDIMATIATLMGLTPPRVETARVLELGSAAGGNIIPMAVGLPQATFLGIDYSAAEIAEGQAALDVLRLPNISLRHMNILDVTPDLGIFDYIIIHGVYSWVPKTVQAKILDICRQNLAPNGIAYVSYNAYPGWHMLGAVREMMLFHTRDISDPQIRATKARSLVDFLVESVPVEGNAPGSLFGAYSHFLRHGIDRLKSNSDSYILHDDLEEINQPLYFHQFAEQATQHGLEYLAEADFATVFPNYFPPKVKEQLLKLSRDVVEMEQYMDFLRVRTFRRTLLVHDGMLKSRSLKSERVLPLFMASEAKPVSEHADIGGVNVEQFRGGSGATLSTDHPVSKAAMMVLAREWPASLSFDRLLDQAYDYLNTNAETRRARRSQDTLVLSANLLRSYTYSERLVELHSHQPSFVMKASAAPVASPWARVQAEGSENVTNLRHERVELDALGRFVLRLLDGEHDRASLIQALTRPLLEGQLVLHRDGESVPAADAAACLETELEDTLVHLSHAALLVA
jgi:methyltransferase-like protein/predicted O-methyltransferase YrrM